MSTELAVRRPPVVTFGGGPRRFEADSMGAPRFAVAYDVPKDTLDPRYRQCTEHHVACDCREAELAEQLGEHRAEWKLVRNTARRALAGHQIEKPMGLGTLEGLGFPLCLCSGCVIHRETGNLLNWADVDPRTGRVKPVEGSPGMGWAPGEVPF